MSKGVPGKGAPASKGVPPAVKGKGMPGGIQTEDQQEAEVDTGIQAEACSVEVDKGVRAWHVGAVERLPHQ
eukprot:5945180-Karenia_brevis.AAC.1